MTIWHKVFTKGTYEFKNKSETVSTGLCGWANCMAGNQPPENFGHGMICIMDYIGESADVANLHKLAVELLNEKMKNENNTSKQNHVNNN